MSSSELPDVLEEALARVIASQHKQWLKEREHIEAEARATIAEQRAEIAELRAQTTSMMAELTATTRAALLEVEKALSCVKDGKDGDAGPQGPQGEPGIPGQDADPERIIAVVKAEVLAALPPPEKGDPGKDADLEEVSEKAAELVLARMPTPQDGKDADPNAVAEIVLEQLPKPKDGEKGDKGDDVDMDLVAVMIEEATRKAVSQWPVPKDGQDADPELIRSMVCEEVAKLPEPQPGRDGKHAEIDYELIFRELRGDISQMLAELPPPEKGEKGDAGPIGEKGEPGAPGRDGEDGVGMAGLVIDRAGCCIATMTDGTIRELGPIVGKDGAPGRDGVDGKDGAPGIDGRDGLSIEDLSADFDGDRTLTLRFARGDIVKTIPVHLPVPIYRGFWDEKATYEFGDGVSFGGSLWLAQKDTNQKPSTNCEDWRLAVKAGRDGRDGKPGEKGERGPDGRPGRDFTVGKV